jgi:hypothetical protein
VTPACIVVDVLVLASRDFAAVIVQVTVRREIV